MLIVYPTYTIFTFAIEALLCSLFSFTWDWSLYVLIPLFVPSLILFGLTMFAILRHPDDGYVAVWVAPMICYTAKKTKFFLNLNQDIDIRYGTPDRCLKKAVLQAKHMSRMFQHIPEHALCLTDTNDVVVAVLKRQSSIRHHVICSKSSRNLFSVMEKDLFARIYTGCTHQCERYETCQNSPLKPKCALLVCYRKNRSE